MFKFDNQFGLSSPSGAELNVFHCAARENARGIIHINHGLAEHAARYARFANHLADAGYHVYAHDHRGHGKTKADDAPRGVFSSAGDGVQKVLQDCQAVQEHAKAQNPNLPLIMFGHSMGGLITMNYALRHGDKLAGAAVWNANFSGGLLGRAAQAILAFEKFRLGSDVPSRLLPKLTFATWAKQIPNRRTDFDWLSHIEAEVDAYVSDEKCGWDASVSLWQNIFELIFAGGNPSSAATEIHDLPLHLLGGGKDPATDFAKATMQQADRLKAAGFNNISTRVFPNARHETLNDRDQGEATKAFHDFAEMALAR